MIACLTGCFVKNWKRESKPCSSGGRGSNKPALYGAKVPRHLIADDASAAEATATGPQCHHCAKHNGSPSSVDNTQHHWGAPIPVHRRTAALAPGQATATEAVLRARDAMVVNNSPSIITILTKYGDVVYQNRQSKAFFGDRSTGRAL
ncbi:hypothetical protein Vretimale_17186, partial [Volvox reticuliferus]